MEELCERCGWPKNAMQLATLEYHGITIRACFSCIAKVAGVISRVPLVKRASEIHRLKERWQKGREARERQAS